MYRPLSHELMERCCALRSAYGKIGTRIPAYNVLKTLHQSSSADVLARRSLTMTPKAMKVLTIVLHTIHHPSVDVDSAEVLTHPKKNLLGCLLLGCLRPSARWSTHARPHVFTSRISGPLFASGFSRLLRPAAWLKVCDSTIVSPRSCPECRRRSAQKA